MSNQIINSKVIEKYTEMNQYGKLINLKLIALKKGVCTFELKVEKKHLATLRAIHGGVLSSIMDQIMGVAALAEVEHLKKLVATLEFKISYYNPGFLGDKLTCTGEIVKAGNRILYSKGKILNQEGLLIAEGSGTFNAYPAEKVGVKL